MLFKNIFKLFHISLFASIDRFDLVHELKLTIMDLDLQITWKHPVDLREISPRPNVENDMIRIIISLM